MKKRFFIIFIILVVLFPFVAQADTFIEALNNVLNDTVSYAVIGDQLVIICDYEKMNAAEDNPAESILDQYTEELAQYESIIMLFEKDGSIYLGTEMSLKNGVFTEGTGSVLMSTQYLQENISFGQ